MSWHTLFKWVKPTPDQKSVRLDGIVHALARYLLSVTRDDAEAEIRPAMAAKMIHESELAVLAAFHVLEKDDLVNPHYGLYCRNRQAPIDVYAALSAVPEEIECPFCEDDVHTTDSGSAQIELFFTVNDRDRLKSFTSAAA